MASACLGMFGVAGRDDATLGGADVKVTFPGGFTIWILDCDVGVLARDDGLFVELGIHLPHAEEEAEAGRHSTGGGRRPPAQGSCRVSSSIGSGSGFRIAMKENSARLPNWCSNCPSGPSGDASADPSTRPCQCQPPSAEWLPAVWNAGGGGADEPEPEPFPDPF